MCNKRWGPDYKPGLRLAKFEITQRFILDEAVFTTSSLGSRPWEGVQSVQCLLGCTLGSTTWK